MKKNYFDPGYLKKFFIPGGIILCILFLIIFIYFTGKNKNKNVPIKEGQIQIVRGDEMITINENGLVEYKSKDRTFYETWDSSQISSFFSMMEKKARDYIGKRVSGGDCGYKVFMFVDNKLVTICIDSGDKDMSETIEPILIKYADDGVSDFFGDDDDIGDDDGDDFGGSIIFPTVSPGVWYSSPTPIPVGDNSNTNYLPVKADCETWNESIVRNRAIISNTYCTVINTPTPEP